MIIAAFDLATATGVCDGQVGGRARLFSWYLSDAGTTHGARFHALAEFLNRYFAQEPCDAVVYEKPLDVAALANMHRNDAMVMFARGCIGVLEERCYALKKPCEAISVQDARQLVLGWRRNSKKSGLKTKDRVMRDVRLHGVKPENDNEADAYVLWACASARSNPRLAAALTPLFGGVMQTDVSANARRRGDGI